MTCWFNFVIMNPMATTKTSKEILREFFVEQSFELYSAGTRRRRSVLIELENDLQYAVGLPEKLRKLGITQSQDNRLSTEFPYVSPLLIYCSAVDLIARVYHKQSIPPPGKNGEWFKESAELFFEYDKQLADALWDLRNSLSHSYSINGYVFTRGFSDSDLPVTKDANDAKTHIIATRKCVTSLRKARLKAYDTIVKQSKDEVDNAARYVSDHFIYLSTEESRPSTKT